MKKIILIIWMTFNCLILKAQYLDSASIVLTKPTYATNVITKRNILLKTGDTLELQNINTKVYFAKKGRNYYEFNPRYLDSAINIQLAKDYLRRYVKRLDKYIKKFGMKFGPSVALKDIQVGMSEEMILEIKDGDMPTHINTSHYSFGVFEQWIYQDDVTPQWTEYYYFKNGKLTSWQD